MLGGPATVAGEDRGMETVILGGPAAMPARSATRSIPVGGPLTPEIGRECRSAPILTSIPGQRGDNIGGAYEEGEYIPTSLKQRRVACCTFILHQQEHHFSFYQGCCIWNSYKVLNLHIQALKSLMHVGAGSMRPSTRQTAAAMGSAAWGAPEQARQASSSDQASRTQTGGVMSPAPLHSVLEPKTSNS